MGCGNAKQGEPANEPVSAKSAVPEPAVAKNGATAPKDVDGERSVMGGKYKMLLNKEDTMGEGTSSICRKGINVSTGADVAIKVYKGQKGGGKVKDVILFKFKRQIDVLQDLQLPFTKPTNPIYWHGQMDTVKPAGIFMILIDYSQDSKKVPAADPVDGVLYVVTELAQYSLKDFLAQRRDQGRKPFELVEVKSMSKAVLVAMAGLHAKGYVHVDMKPENMMMFNGRLKVIDVDGCVRMGSQISISDSSISFSPCYCAPEWARFLIKEEQSKILADPALDVWSVGMTLCELVTLDAILKPHYANFLRNAHSNKEAGFLFMEWLSSIKKVPMPRSIEKFDTQMHDLIFNWLFACEQSKRKTCAQSLEHPFVVGASFTQEEGKSALAVEGEVSRIIRNRVEDDSTLAPIFKGTLWKMNTNGDPKDAAQYIKRDMWIAHNHSLCYFSVKEDKRLVLIDGGKLNQAIVEHTEGYGKQFTFKVTMRSDDENEKTPVVAVFAAESAEERNEWTKRIKEASRLEVFVTMKLGAKFEDELKTFKLTVKNRRMKVENDKDGYEPNFKGKLWKLKAEGDRLKEDHWFLRDMWTTKNGSLAYYSTKDERDLIYYTAQDISRATVESIPAGTFQTYAFTITLESKGVEFEPGTFAAQSQKEREEWLTELGKFKST